jgi:hypothetical protein
LWIGLLLVLLKEWLALYFILSLAGYNLPCSPTNEKQGPIHEEMSQTLLTNKKKGNVD